MYLAFLLRSKIISKITWHVILLISILLPSSTNLKATSTFFISLLVASCQYVLLFILSSSKVSSYVADISIPNFIFFLTLLASLLIITFLYLRADGTHRENYGSLSILFAFSYSAISTGLVSFI